jgi:hypothetical protein
MKNIHILATKNKSSIILDNNKLKFVKDIPATKEGWNSSLVLQNIYITNSEDLILGGYHFNSKYGDEPQKTVQRDIDSRKYWEEDAYYISKIILTTDPELINDGVQAIDDEFLEWFVKNPSCEEVEIINTFDYIKKGYVSHSGYKIQITKEEPKQETLEEAAEKYAELSYYNRDEVDAFVSGAKWQQEISYSDEEAIQLLIKFNQEIIEVEDVRGWFEQFKKK